MDALRKCSRLCFIAVATYLWFVGSSFASSFTLEYGQRFALCRSFARNLEAFPALGLGTYEWPMDPRLKDFRKPAWRPVDGRQNLDVIRTIFIWSADPHAQWNEQTAASKWQAYQNEVLSGLADGTARLDRARVDFNNDGRIDTVYRFYHVIHFVNEQVAREKRFGYWYIFYSDRESTPYQPFRRYMDEFNLFDAFLFKGRFFLLTWFGTDLIVDEPRSVRAGLEVALIDDCHLRFTQ